MEVVLDTNVVVSATINRMGNPARIVKAWEAGAFIWIISGALVEELVGILGLPRIRRRIVWSGDELNNFLFRLRQGATQVTPTTFIEVVGRDPDDNRVLEAAVAGEADYIVTGDRDLLELGEYEGIRIVTPVAFVALLSLEST